MKDKTFEQLRLEKAEKLLKDTFDDVLLAMSLQDPIMTNHFIRKMKFQADFYLYERDKNKLN